MNYRKVKRNFAKNKFCLKKFDVFIKISRFLLENSGNSVAI